MADNELMISLQAARKMAVESTLELEYYEEKHLLFSNGEAFIIQQSPFTGPRFRERGLNLNLSRLHDAPLEAGLTEVNPEFDLQESEEEEKQFHLQPDQESSKQGTTLNADDCQKIQVQVAKQATSGKLEEDDSVISSSLASEKKIETEEILPKAKKISCDFCPYTTSRRSHLNEHTRMIHLKIKTVCDLCGKEFSNINQHMRVVHKVLRSGIISKTECKLCQKEFYDITKHMAKAHSLKYVYEFNCQQCDIKFKSRYSMNRHFTRKHTKTGECGECGKKVVNLSNHISKVHQNKPIVLMCPLCSRVFKKKTALVRHLTFCTEKHTSQIIVNNINNEYAIIDPPADKEVCDNFTILSTKSTVTEPAKPQRTTAGDIPKPPVKAELTNSESLNSLELDTDIKPSLVIDDDRVSPHDVTSKEPDRLTEEGQMPPHCELGLVGDVNHQGVLPTEDQAQLPSTLDVRIANSLGLVGNVKESDRTDSQVTLPSDLGVVDQAPHSGEFRLVGDLRIPTGLGLVKDVKESIGLGMQVHVPPHAGLGPADNVKNLDGLDLIGENIKDASSIETSFVICSQGENIGDTAIALRESSAMMTTSASIMTSSTFESSVESVMTLTENKSKLNPETGSLLQCGEPIYTSEVEKLEVEPMLLDVGDPDDPEGIDFDSPLLFQGLTDPKDHYFGSQSRFDQLTFLESDNQNFMECTGLDEDVLEDAKKFMKSKGKNNRMIVCRLCPGQKLVRNFEKHFEKFHTEKPKKMKEAPRYQCDLCGYKTDRYTNFSMHVKTVHLKARTVCHLCGKEYSNINQHMRVIHKITKSGLKTKNDCKICGHSFYDLKQHLRRAHQIADPEKNTTCEVCNEKFTKHSNMLRHMKRIHEGVKDACTICWKQVSNVAKHRKLHKDIIISMPGMGSLTTGPITQLVINNTPDVVSTQLLPVATTHADSLLPDPSIGSTQLLPVTSSHIDSTRLLPVTSSHVDSTQLLSVSNSHMDMDSTQLLPVTSTHINSTQLQPVASSRVDSSQLITATSTHVDSFSSSQTLQMASSGIQPSLPRSGSSIDSTVQFIGSNTDQLRLVSSGDSGHTIHIVSSGPDGSSFQMVGTGQLDSSLQQISSQADGLQEPAVELSVSEHLPVQLVSSPSVQLFSTKSMCNPIQMMSSADPGMQIMTSAASKTMFQVDKIASTVNSQQLQLVSTSAANQQFEIVTDSPNIQLDAQTSSQRSDSAHVQIVSTGISESQLQLVSSVIDGPNSVINGPNTVIGGPSSVISGTSVELTNTLADMKHIL